MPCPSLYELPLPASNKSGWPWTEESPRLPATMPGGQAWPKISIVTPSYNQGQYLEETLRSILLQGYPNLEYTIVDGGSTDNSLEVIQKYSPWLTSWVSEPDRGQAHAINKGLSRVTGKIFNWINSDDILAPHALETIALAHKDKTIVAGSVVRFEDQARDKNEVANLSSSGLIHWKEGINFQQPGLWLQPELIASCGGIDETFHYSFDWDLLIRYLALYPEVTYISPVLVYFRLHENSKTSCQAGKFVQEELQILRKLWRLEAFRELHRDCGFRIRQLEWNRLVEKIHNDGLLPARQRGLKIAMLACHDPVVRWNRFTAGLVRQLLF